MATIAPRSSGAALGQCNNRSTISDGTIRAMIGLRGLSRWLVNDQQRLTRFDDLLAPADFRAFDESMKGAQRPQLVLPRVDSLDTFDRGFERERQASHFQRAYWRMSSANFFSKLNACELVNGIPQLRRMVFDGFNDAAKNHRKVNLR